MSRSRRPQTARRRTSRLPRARRLLAAALAALVVGLSLHLALQRPGADAAPALVATRALAVGHVLAPADVEVRQLSAGALPVGHLTAATEAVGRPVAAPLVPGEVVHPKDLRTTDLLTGLEEGSVAVFLPLAEPAVAAAVASGDRLDVHSPVDGRPILTRALVVGTSPGERPGVWIAVDGTGATAVAAARAADPVGASVQVSLHHTPTGE